MSNIGPIASINVKQRVIENCWNYVDMNFGKFTEANKIKVALAIMTKDMPTQLSGEVMKQIINITSNGKSEGLLNRLESKSEELSREVPV